MCVCFFFLLFGRGPRPRPNSKNKTRPRPNSKKTTPEKPKQQKRPDNKKINTLTRQQHHFEVTPTRIVGEQLLGEQVVLLSSYEAEAQEQCP